MWRMRLDECSNCLRVRRDRPFAHDLSSFIDDADRCQLQRHVQSDIVLHAALHHCKAPIRWASSLPGELIPSALVWLAPGITPCAKTLKSQQAGELFSLLPFF